MANLIDKRWFVGIFSNTVIYQQFFQNLIRRFKFIYVGSWLNFQLNNSSTKSDQIGENFNAKSMYNFYFLQNKNKKGQHEPKYTLYVTSFVTIHILLLERENYMILRKLTNT